MLTAAGCKQRVSNFLMALQPTATIRLADPLHLRYLAGLYVDPFNLSADFGAVLAIEPDGTTTLSHDHRLPKESIANAHADKLVALPWYDGQTPGHGPRRMILASALPDGPAHDTVGHPQAARTHEALARLRRRKLPDEIELLKRCMMATEAGHAWAMANIAAGMTELDVYTGVFAVCTKAVGHASIVYGDFAVSPGTSRKGGPPTGQILKDGDLFILDFSVVIGGYRSDFTNSLSVGKKPSTAQQEQFDLCLAAMAAGEAQLKAGTRCQAVYDAVAGVFAAAGKLAAFPHHAGHGLGVSHPEAPFFVAHSSEVLQEGDVVTLEPGLYVDGVGGMRIEHNYAITATGYERLSHHRIALV